jgi:branched-chain amino acid transport system permease protein
VNASETARSSLPLVWTVALLAGILVVVPLILTFVGRSYLYQVANIMMIFALLAASMHLVTGVAGLLQLGHAAFYGVGAYTAAILASGFGLPFAVTLPAAGVAGALIALLVALPTMRLVSIYFAVATLGIGQMLNLVMLNWVSVTKGPNGILLFGGLKIFGFDFSKPAAAYFVVAAVVIVSIYTIHRLSHSYYGNALRALREDDQCADAMGIDTVRLKIESFTISGFFAGLAGALWAHTAGYISPPDFNFNVSILILAMVVLGGLGSLPGAIIGAMILIGLPELLREFKAGDLRNVIIGVVLFGSILFVPKGLIGEASALELMRRQFAGAWRSGSKNSSKNSSGIGWR